MIFNVRCSCGAPCDYFGNAGEPIGTPPVFMCVARRVTGSHRVRKSARSQDAKIRSVYQNEAETRVRLAVRRANLTNRLLKGAD